MQNTTKIENIQRMLFLFEQNQKLITIKGEEYDLLLENYIFEDINKAKGHSILSLRFHKNKDLYAILQKLHLKKFMYIQVSIFNNINLQLSYILDTNITIDTLLSKIQLLEELA
jgi:hypothetical protein